MKNRPLIKEQYNNSLFLHVHFDWEIDSYNAFNIIQDYYDSNHHQLYHGWVMTDDLGLSHAHIEIDILDFVTGKFWLDLPVELDSEEIKLKLRIAKYVYLFNQYKINKRWEYPINVHYNPRLDIFVCHPGSVRAQILSLVNAKTTLVYYHTIDKSIIPTGKLKPVRLNDIRQRYDKAINIDIGFIPDHGALIPQISFDTWLKSKYLEDNLEQIKLNLSRLIIISANRTRDLRILSPFLVDNPKKFRNHVPRYILRITNYSIESEIKCFLSMCARKNYSDDNMMCKLCN